MPQQVHSTKLTLGLIARILGTDDPSEILSSRALYMQALGLRSIGDLEALSSVEEFYLSRNELQSLGKALQPLASSLIVLSLSHNQLHSIADAEMNTFTSLRVLDLAHNYIESIDPQNELPLHTLTILDLRENPCTIDLDDSIDAPALQEFNGLRVKKIRRTIIIPLLGETPNEPRRRTVRLELTNDDNFETIARDFCKKHAVSKQEEAIPELLTIMHDAFSKPSIPSSNITLSTTQEHIENQIDATYKILSAFPQELETVAQDARNFASAAINQKRESIQKRRIEPRQIPKNDKLLEHNAQVTARRNEFAERVRNHHITLSMTDEFSSEENDPYKEEESKHALNLHLLQDEDDDEWLTNDEQHLTKNNNDILLLDLEKTPRFADIDDAIYDGDEKLFQ